MRHWRRRKDGRGKVHLVDVRQCKYTGDPWFHSACAGGTGFPAFAEIICAGHEIADNLHKLEGQKLCRTCLKKQNLNRQQRAKVYEEAV